ncbi:MAG: T9SS type A sorting domain-containing protein [Saprospiraceae bacterium]|nr:T9SS type A sorting domain-containing protein [Saprospiraceae bacterium]
MRQLILLAFLLFQSSIYSQETFFKVLDFEDFKNARQIVLYEDRIFILVTGVCDQLYECSLYMEIDDQGEILWQKRLPWLDVASNSMIIENDTIFISGNHPSQEKWLWHQMSVDGGDSLATYEVFEEGNIFNRMFNLGQAKYGDQFCIYGPGNRDDRETSLLYFVDQNGQVDTLVELFNTDIDCDPFEVIPDNEGNLVAFIRYREEGKNRQRVVSKINSDKELFWTYFSEENAQQDAIPNGAILEDGTIVYNSREQFNKAEKLRGIGPDSTIGWWYDPTNVTGQTREFNKIHTIQDGSIIGLGMFGNRNVDPAIWEVPWITKIADDESKIWERAYYSFKDDGEDTHFGWFNDAVELNDGSFIVIGRIILNANNSKTTVIARLDSDGCLEPDCGVFNDVTELLTSTQTIEKIEFEIYPNPVEDNFTIKMEGTPEKVEIFNLSGQLIKEAEYTKSIGLDDMPKGIYLVKIFMDGKIEIKEVVKS